MRGERCSGGCMMRRGPLGYIRLRAVTGGGLRQEDRLAARSRHGDRSDRPASRDGAPQLCGHLLVGIGRARKPLHLQPAQSRQSRQ